MYTKKYRIACRSTSRSLIFDTSNIRCVASENVRKKRRFSLFSTAIRLILVQSKIRERKANLCTILCLFHIHHFVVSNGRPYWRKGVSVVEKGMHVRSISPYENTPVTFLQILATCLPYGYPVTCLQILATANDLLTIWYLPATLLHCINPAQYLQ